MNSFFHERCRNKIFIHVLCDPLLGSFSGNVAFRRHVWEKSRSQDTGPGLARPHSLQPFSTTTPSYSCQCICLLPNFQGLEGNIFLTYICIPALSMQQHSYKKCWIPDLTLTHLQFLRLACWLNQMQPSTKVLTCQLLSASSGDPSYKEHSFDRRMITLNRVSQTEKIKYHVTSFIGGI